MEMRTLVPILVIAVTFCFDPATSNRIKDGKKGTKQGTDTVSSCLQKAMAKDNNAIDGVIEFLCSFMKYKNTTNKEELIQAIENLEEVTGCGTKDIFGSDASLEQLHLDENNVLTSQIIAMEKLLKNYILMPIVAPVCDLLDYIENSTDIATQDSAGKGQGHKRATRDILSLVGGLSGGLGGIGGLLNLLGLVGTLLSPLTTLLSGLSGVTNLIGGLGNGATGLLVAIQIYVSQRQLKASII
ncbi:uncharacterized protein LOC120981608 [Bufo bufo]|uniref:uncharacterized protein LOC120981608 n=1 Tax=Bufo bufo TaxID=8384 RepID=UPI001ABDB2FA|nr:uncharacterized protein LOC120981608 [Bufo bufo]